MADEEREPSKPDENPYAPPRAPHIAKAGATVAAGCLAAFCGFIACFTTCTGTVVVIGFDPLGIPALFGVLTGVGVWWWVQKQLHQRAANEISKHDDLHVEE